MTPWKFLILTFGCKVNQYESQSIREHWQTCGGVETDTLEQANIVLLNSCAITARAERDARAALYRLQREAPQARCILTGCSAQLLAAVPTLRTLYHAVYPVRDKALLLTDPRILVDLPQDAVTTPTKTNAHTEQNSTKNNTYPPFSIKAFRRARPVLKVQDGCTHRCTYCIVPTVRSFSSSRPVHETIAEARRLLEAGHREIMISGINLLLYGRDFTEKTDFWSLIAKLDQELAPEWAGRARFRISSLEPKQLHERGLMLLAESRMLCPHLHISLQSGSQAVLRRMGRGHYRPERLVDAMATLAQAWPRFALGADILMGFPGEKEEHVRDTLALVDALPFTYAHVFPYSRRPGTAANNFADQIPQPEKSARAARVRKLIQQKQLAFWRRTVHEQAQLLIALDASDRSTNNALHKGIDQCYVPCHLEGVLDNNHDLIQAKAVRISPDGIIAQRV